MMTLNKLTKSNDGKRARARINHVPVVGILFWNGDHEWWLDMGNGRSQWLDPSVTVSILS